MNSEELRALQAPLKAAYRDNPQGAVATMHAEGRLGEGITCTLSDGSVAGLHPKAGGDGTEACSGDMLLEALVACAGVTLRAVATAMGIDIRGGTVRAEGDVDFRGTLGVDRETPVGFRSIRLRFDLDTDAEPATVEKLISLTERYCVVYQTLLHPPEVSVEAGTAS
jgi:uncharacterized OsmC-like protein